MLWNRWLPALLATTTLAAGCAGNSNVGAPPLAQQTVQTAQTASDSALQSQRFRRTSAPTAVSKKIGHFTSGDAQPTWTFLEPLMISGNGSFSALRNAGCSPMDPAFGIWYIALGSFTLPDNGATLPACNVSSSPPPWQGWSRTKNRAPHTSTAGSNNNLYIVELTADFFNVTVTPIAGPVNASGAKSWNFSPMQGSLSFSGGKLYSFFVASFSGPFPAQPGVTCVIGATACSLGSNPTPGNKLIAVVSDGSGQLPNLVVKDSAGNALTQETISPNCGHCVAVYDETVPAGITNTVTYSGADGVFYPYVSAVYELTNVTSGAFASANTGLVPNSLASSISGVSSNDVQLCAYIQTGVSTGNVALAFSNGALETYDYQSSGAAFAHETAGADASSTCTANNINAGYQAGMAYADYH